MKLGIVGLPNVGKSTLFNAITSAGAEAANYPFCTIDPNMGVVAVPDPRLDKLAEMYHPEKVTPAVIQFMDIAGLVRGASKGEGLGNRFLSHIRESDAIVHVVRCFENGDIVHVEGGVDPVRDAEIINMELIYADLELVERRLDRVRKAMKGDRTLAAEAAFFERLLDTLNNGLPARSLSLTEDEQAWLNDCPLLSLKPVVYAANLGEDELAAGAEQSPHYRALAEVAERENARILPICAQLEAEIAELDGEEKVAFLQELGIEQSGLDRLVVLCYDLLNLISFLTAGQPEVRAWTIEKGTKAPQAAGKIHSDIERGFIRAEVIDYGELLRCGSLAAAKEQGLIRSEGREYVMRDGDVVLFRFNV